MEANVNISPRKPSPSIPAPLITHEQARSSVEHLINSIFQREPKARFSIPVNDSDDDIVVMAYIAQQEFKERLSK